MDIPQGEEMELDHLVFVVHGIGSACDSKLRSIVEVVDLFREMSAQLLDKHFENVYGCKKINRVEFLPVNWHTKLHQDKGTDAAISPLTLPSLPMLRTFTNSTILDVLYYASPVHCQIIQDTTAMRSTGSTSSSGRGIRDLKERFLSLVTAWDPSSCLTSSPVRTNQKIICQNQKLLPHTDLQVVHHPHPQTEPPPPH